MPIVTLNGIALSFTDHGPDTGKPVVLVTGSGGRGQMWTPHQVPALTAAGYRVITMDNRGVPPTELGWQTPAVRAGFTIGDMVADTACLIDHLKIGPARIVGFSLGGIIAAELLLTHPELISQAVLMASRGRTDAMRQALVAAEGELLDSGTELPARYAAAMQAMLYLSARTRSDERQIRDWLDVFEMVPPDPAISRAQHGLDLIENRLEHYRKITSQCLVMAFGDDLIVPPHLSRELADYIPDCKYDVIPDCGHYGCLERPEAVNASLLAFFAGATFN